MFHSLDIFKIDPGGRVHWRGAVESFVAAKARIQKLALSSLSSPASTSFWTKTRGSAYLSCCWVSIYNLTQW